MNARWKWTAIPLMLALVTTPLAFAGEAPETTRQLAQTAGPEPWIGPDVDTRIEGDARVLAIAEQVGAWQLGSLGETPRQAKDVADMDASGALSVLASRHGAELGPLDALTLSSMDEGLDDALSAVVVAFLVLEDESREAFGAADPQAVRDDPWAFTDAWQLAGVVSAQERLLEATMDLETRLESDPARLPVPVMIPGVVALQMTGTCVDDVYTVDAPLVVDECGDDEYRNNAGGASLADINGAWCSGEIPLAAAAVIDLEGNDLFGEGRNCGANGGGFLGAGFLYDAAGDDVYFGGEDDGAATGNDGVNGGAVAGAGFLVDRSGADRYIAGGWGTNGGAYPGARALLIDMEGDDEYSGSFDAVNGGGLGGAGTLWDEQGNDLYEAWSSGVNGGSTLGAGLLYDGGGHDRYEDSAGGEGVDVTVVPKETNGAQVDDEA